MNGICKLCGKTDLLKESHVIPDFFIRGLEHKLATGSRGILQPFSMLLSTPMGGYLYLFAVSKQKPRISLQELCVKSNGEMIIPVEDERRILRGWAVALRKAGRL